MIKTKRRVSKTASVQAPTGGLNSRDAIANMKETEAVTMENWFPTPSSVDIRNGYVSHATGVSENFETLAAYSTGVTNKLFGAGGGNIYDVTNPGVIGAAVVSGLSNSRLQSITMGTAGGYFLMMVNGNDKLQYYDGSVWSVDGGVHTITGVNTVNIAAINNFKNRVWLIEKNSFNAWYLPVASIAGAANVLDLSGLFKLGGYVMAMANWTIDNAAGIDDYAAFITSQGEVALYKGTDPSSASTWALVGTFRMGAPLGRRCFCKAGADVLVLTTDGAFPLSKALLTDRTQSNLAASDKITDLINTDAQMYKNNFGWQPIIFPIGNKLIINVPTIEDSVSYQYVMNTINQSWTKFTGWTAFCFETLGDRLFFGGINGVFECDTGTTDDGNVINAVVQQAYSYFGSHGTQKKFSMVRPIFLSDGAVNPAVLLNTDFAQDRTTVAPTFTSNSDSLWDFSTWDVSSWANGNIILKQWQSVTGVGFCGGIRIVTQTSGLSCKWEATDFILEEGEVF